MERDTLAAVNASRLVPVAVAVVCAVLGVYLAMSSRGEARLHRADAHVLAGRNTAALAKLKGLDGEYERRAWVLRGYAYFGTGRLERARVELQKAVRRDPNNWVLQRDYAIVLLRLGERPKARARMRRAVALNPRMLLPPGFVLSK